MLINANTDRLAYGSGPGETFHGCVMAQRARSHDRIDLFTLALSMCASVTYERGETKARTQQTDGYETLHEADFSSDLT